MRSTVFRCGVATALTAMSIAATACGGSGSSAGGDDDPASVLPGNAPIAGLLQVGPDSDPGKALIAFAEKVDPSNRDLGEELIKSLNEDEDDIDYERDIEPWLGERMALAFDDFEAEDGGGAIAVQSKDQDAAKKFLERNKKEEKAKDRTYQETGYYVGADGQAFGVVGDFVVLATDEAHFKRAVDASKGDSLADDSEYKDAVETASDDAVAVGVLQVEPFLRELADSDAVPRETLEQIRTTPGIEGANSVTMALLADEQEVSLEFAADGAEDAPEAEGGPRLADLPGEAWLAFAGPILAEQFSAGFRDGLEQGGPQVAQQLERFGLVDFIEGLDGASLRLGGTSFLSVSGELTLGGDDQAAAEKLVRQMAPEVQRAVGTQAKVRRTDAGFEVQALPYSASVEARDGDLTISSGERPSGKLGDEQAYKDAVESLDLDGGTATTFVDFAPIAELVASIPGQDQANSREVQRVLKGLGTFIVGSSRDGDVARTKMVLTAR